VATADGTGAISDRDVWVQFDSSGIDVPGHAVLYMFNTIAAAVDVVADGGVVHIEPGTTRERGAIGKGKRCTLVAPIGGVIIGALGG
jgi:hypothetical protein